MLLVTVQKRGSAPGESRLRAVVVFDLQPRLASELLLLRPLSAADFDALYAVAADPAVWEQHPSKDRTEEPVFRRWFDNALACGGALVAVDSATGEVFVTSRFVLRGPDEAEIGWTFLARSRWGGCGTVR